MAPTSLLPVLGNHSFTGGCCKGFPFALSAHIRGANRRCLDEVTAWGVLFRCGVPIVWGPRAPHYLGSGSSPCSWILRTSSTGIRHAPIGSFLAWMRL